MYLDTISGSFGLRSSRSSPFKQFSHAKKKKQRSCTDHNSYGKYYNNSHQNFHKIDQSNNYKRLASYYNKKNNCQTSIRNKKVYKPIINLTKAKMIGWQERIALLG